MELTDRVREFSRLHGLAEPTTRVTIALSGGSDSIALAHIIRALDAAGELRAVGFAHFNHQLRPAADDDERFCVRLAETFGWPIVVEREDVAARARQERRSLENAGRTARHAFFERARLRFGADVVAVGHTRDDQAETFLLRLIRGAGPRGLSAMHPRNGSIVRPLLSCRRDELRAYLAARLVAYVEDDSNADVRILRNRVRAELLPLIQGRFNPRIVDVLADEADLARDLWHWLETSARDLLCNARLPRAESATGDPRAQVVQLDVAQFMAQPSPVRRCAVWRAMSALGSGRPISFKHVQAVLRLFEGESAPAVDSPGQRAERLGAKVVLTSRLPRLGRYGEDCSNFFDVPLSIPGEVPVPLAGCVLSAETSPDGVADLEDFRQNAAVAIVRRDRCGGQLRVRNRRPGDRFRPVGLGGRKKLQDFFVDRKVARKERDAVPLVVDETDQIVWVAGHGIDEAFRVTEPSQAVLILRLKSLGGPA
jgi:tRNA(Ile)-lysidine synthase